MTRFHIERRAHSLRQAIIARRCERAALGALILAIVGAGAATVHAYVAEPDVPPVASAVPTYALVQTFAGEAFVIDHGQSFGDCVDAMNAMGKAKEATNGALTFACELER